MVIFEGVEYDSIVRFDGHVLEFEKSVDGKCTGYCTVLPISPKKFRDENYTDDYAKVEISYIKDFCIFRIFGDDYSTYEVLIREEYKEEIAKVIEDIKNDKIGMEVIFK